MLRALPAVECSGLTEEAWEAPVGLIALSLPENPVVPYPASSLVLLLGSLGKSQPSSYIVIGLSTHKTCLFTLRSSLASPILESKTASSAFGSWVACGSAPVEVPKRCSSYLSPPGLRICREIPWSLPSGIVDVMGLVDACPTEPDSAFALRVAAEPYTEVKMLVADHSATES